MDFVPDSKKFEIPVGERFERMESAGEE